MCESEIEKRILDGSVEQQRFASGQEPRLFLGGLIAVVPDPRGNRAWLTTIGQGSSCVGASTNEAIGALITEFGDFVFAAIEHRSSVQHREELVDRISGPEEPTDDEE